ncbi:MAG: hypothetical protein CMI30_06545 [Opitutae bacterium]|nr:hypothetical protein [Opitutae bacterium]|tara:strand:- start:8619 stop:9695 length:1077 start_codon:yes stop_codon:yes gene_type:complete
MTKAPDFTKRLPYVDVVKGIGILLVVLGHNAACEPGFHLTTFIYSFHMPLFFFLAGVFHDETRTLVSHLASKTRSLLLPCLLAFLAWVTLQAIFMPEVLFPILGDLSLNALYGTGKTLFWGQLWFLTSLFVTTCVCHVLIKAPLLKGSVIRSAFALALIPAGIALLEWAPTLHSIFIGERNFIVTVVGLPWNIDLLPITAMFYLLGTSFPKRSVENQKWNPPMFFLGATTAFVLAGCGVLLLDWGMDLNNRRYDHWAGSTCVAICGIGGVLLLSLALEKLAIRWPTKTLSFIGQRSLFILVLHFSLQQNSFGKMISLNIPWSVAYVCSFAIGLIVPIGVSLLWERNWTKTRSRKKPVS